MATVKSNAWSIKNVLSSEADDSVSLSPPHCTNLLFFSTVPLRTRRVGKARKYGRVVKGK